jgi:hypothetical protein
LASSSISNAWLHNEKRQIPGSQQQRGLRAKFGQIAGGRSVKDEVDDWLEPRETMELILERREELLEGFTEAELRARRWRGLRDRSYNERALKVLVETGAMKRKSFLLEGVRG